MEFLHPIQPSQWSNGNSGLRKFKKHSAISDLLVCWAFGVDTAVAGCTHSALSLVNSNHRSRANYRPSVSVCLAVSTPKAQRTGRSLTAECFFNFPELPFDHQEGWMRWRNDMALWTWCFYGNSLHCIVTRERFVGLACLESPAFLRFKWRNNTANNTEPKTRLKRPWIAPKLQTRHKDNPMLK